MRKLTALIMLSLVLSSAVWGQVPNLPKTPKEGTEQLPAQKIPAGTHELTAQDLETFLDGIMTAKRGTHGPVSFRLLIHTAASAR